MFDVIGFDLDGTLVDSAADLAHATNHALASIGRAALPVDTVSSFLGGGAKMLLTRVLEATGGTEPGLVDLLLPRVIDHYAAHIADYTRPYDGVEAALDQFAQAGARIAICTNKRESLAISLIEKLGWQGRFVTIVGGDTVGILKPDPAPLAEMAKRAGGGSLLFVGDSDNDTRAAQALGVPVILFPSGYGEAHEPKSLGADAIISGFSEIFGVAAALYEQQPAN